MTVTPGKCLTGGEIVTVTASGVFAGSPGGISECNGTADQPTVSVEGSQVPVGCTDPLAVPVTTTSSKTLSASFGVITGITGPPATGSDSAGTSAMSDAVKYPCPPTPAQVAAGATCTLSFGDESGDQVSVNIGFVPGTPLTSTKAGSTISSASGL